MCGDALEKYIEVGQPAIAEYQIDSGTKTGERFRTHIRGWNVGEYVLLDWPDDPGKSLLVRRHGQYLVRFLADGVACGFLSNIWESEIVRRAHFRVRWPEKVETVRLRRYERMSLKTACQAVLPGGDEVEGQLLDISVGGCRLSLETPAEEGGEVRLSFSLEEGLLMTGIRALVRSVWSQDGSSLAGCEFVDLDDRRRYDIEFFLAAAQGRLRKHERQAQRVLVCASDLEQLAAFRQLFEQHGLDVATATNLVDAIYLLRLSTPNVLVLPNRLDGATWQDVCRILRCTRSLDDLAIAIWLPSGEKPDRASSSTRLIQGWFTDIEQAPSTVLSLLPEPMAAEGANPFR